MNHLLERVEKLFKEWGELELDETCSSLDTYLSVQISKVENTIFVTKKYKGNSTELARYNTETEVLLIDNPLPTPVFSLLIHGLEKAIEDN